jgi:GTP-binding protein lepA
MEIIKERLTREFDIDAIVTTPSVLYKATLTSGENIDIDSPQKMPEVTKIKTMSEPYILATILSPDEFIGGIMNLCQDKRGIYKEMTYLDKTRVKILYELPLAEIVYDFFDKLKSITKGYASFDYEIIGYKESNLVKIDILVNSEKVDALSLIAPKENAYERGKIIVDALKEVIPRALFEIPIQASLNAKVIARSTVKAMRKDVLAKCYGGDVSRKKKLLEKQKKGKKKMKMIGSVELPTEAFLAILKTDE